METRLKQVREATGLNMRDFAQRLGVSHGNISLLENGKHKPTNQMVKSICREFGVNETWLLTGEGEMYAPKTREQQIAEIAADMIRNNDSLRSQVISVLSEMDDDMLRAGVDAMREFVRRLNEEENKR